MGRPYFAMSCHVGAHISKLAILKPPLKIAWQSKYYTNYVIVQHYLKSLCTLIT